jgi:hypothetical protein
VFDSARQAALALALPPVARALYSLAEKAQDGYLALYSLAGDLQQAAHAAGAPVPRTDPWSTPKPEVAAETLTLREWAARDPRVAVQYTP